MKTRVSLAFISLLFAFGAGMSSCKKNNTKGCTDPQATNYSSDADEDNGTCEYERDKFLGSWTGNKTCFLNPLDSVSNISISADPANIRGIVINDFPDNGLSAKATVNTSDPQRIIIPSQTIVNDLDQYNVSGDGIIYLNTMVINYYKIYDVSNIDTCGLGIEIVE